MGGLHLIMRPKITCLPLSLGSSASETKNCDVFELFPVLPIATIPRALNFSFSPFWSSLNFFPQIPGIQRESARASEGRGRVRHAQSRLAL